MSVTASSKYFEVVDLHVLPHVDPACMHSARLELDNLMYTYMLLYVLTSTGPWVHCMHYTQTRETFRRWAKK